MLRVEVIESGLHRRCRLNNVFASSGVEVLPKVLLSLFRSVSGTGRDLKSPARAQILTLWAILGDTANSKRLTNINK